MRWLRRCFRGRLVFAPRRASPRHVLERVVSEMTLCVTFGGSSPDCRFGRFCFRSKYITFYTHFGPLCPAAQELIWFGAHWPRPASAPRRARLARAPPLGLLPAQPGRRRDTPAAPNDADDDQNTPRFFILLLWDPLWA